MSDSASLPTMEFHGDAALGALLTALEPHGSKALVIDYGGRMIRPGYHVTEVKAGSFVTFDCGGNPARSAMTLPTIALAVSCSDANIWLHLMTLGGSPSTLNEAGGSFVTLAPRDGAQHPDLNRWSVPAGLRESPR